MYTQQEASLLRQKFWVAFGRYMSPIPSSTGEKINWINYRTGIKHIAFKMDCPHGNAYIGIEISHPDFSERELYFNHFKTFRTALEEMLDEKWNWELTANHANANDKACIFTGLKANVLVEAEWPAIISFLKQRIIALDKFWNEYRDIFEMLH